MDSQTGRVRVWRILMGYPMSSSKNSRIFDAIFENPVRADLRWPDVETLLVSLGADITQGSGSRVRVSLNGRRMVLHEPHPRPTLCKDAVRSLRRFLLEAGFAS